MEDGMGSCEEIPGASAALRAKDCNRGIEKDAGSSVSLSPSVNADDAAEGATRLGEISPLVIRLLTRLGDAPLRKRDSAGHDWNARNAHAPQR